MGARWRSCRWFSFRSPCAGGHASVNARDRKDLSAPNCGDSCQSGWSRCRDGGAEVATPQTAWMAPLLAALPTGMTALVTSMRGRRCQLCRTPVRRLLSFCCPRCHLIACENCWQFERDRCCLCEANQIPLFPIDVSWWQQCFGTQVHGGRCTLCLRGADGRVAQWACAGCGHGQCRSCWDDNNGKCSRCGWMISDLPPEVSGKVDTRAHPQITGRSSTQEDSPPRNAERKEVRNA